MGMGEALKLCFFPFLCHEIVKVIRNNLTSEQWITVSRCVTFFHSHHLPHKISSVMSLLLRQTQSFRCTFHSIDPGFAQLILQRSVHFRYRTGGKAIQTKHQNPCHVSFQQPWIWHWPTKASSFLFLAVLLLQFTKLSLHILMFFFFLTSSMGEQRLYL